MMGEGYFRVKENSWEEGYIEYKVDTIKSQDVNIIFDDWHDGYVAFSMGEKRLKDIKDKDFAELIKGRVNDISGVEGYLMEVDLWRKNTDGSYEEIYIEREDRGFFLQQWKLSKNRFDGSKPCYYHDADTQPRSNLKLFGKNELKSIEVIEPEHRLHFFITCGLQKNEG